MRRSDLRYGVLLLGTLGCGAGWHQPPELTPGPWAERQQAQVWVDGKSLQWHSVNVHHDSVSGVPFIKDPRCDTCRVALPLSAVDSVRVGSPVNGFWKSVGLFVAIPFAVLAVICGGNACFPET